MVGQIDTFEDGTTQGWTAGGVMGVPPFPPTNISTGGPAGSGDNYLLLRAIGIDGPGGRLSAFNLSQWAGDYLAAGITAIRMDVTNFGPEDASLRLLFADAPGGLANPGGGPPSNLAITDAVFVPAGGDWTPISFALDPASLTAILGDATTALSNATELRIFHNPSPTFAGPPIGPPPVALNVGVDNILATQGVQVIPEPSSAVLTAVGLLALFIRRRRAGPRGIPDCAATPVGGKGDIQDN
jgi:hypothetical protein